MTGSCERAAHNLCARTISAQSVREVLRSAAVLRGTLVAPQLAMRLLHLATLLAFTGCGPETTSFRTTDQGDGLERAGHSAAAYIVRSSGRSVASVHVWSNGGYIGSSGEPMTHLGFEIQNTGASTIEFDSDAVQLVVFDKLGAALPPAVLTVVTPLGPALVPIAPGATAPLDVYFRIPTSPRVVDAMRVQWALRLGDVRSIRTTNFVRDDDYPVADPPSEVPTIRAGS